MTQASADFSWALTHEISPGEAAILILPETYPVLSFGGGLSKLCHRPIEPTSAGRR